MRLYPAFTVNGGKMKNSYTIERIKKETLLMCNVIDGEDISGISIPELSDTDKYAQFLRPMDGAIDRAVQRLADENVLPLRTFEIGRCLIVEINGISQSNNAEKALSEYITDFGELLGVYLKTGDVVEPVIADGGTLLGDFEDISGDRVFTVEYLPKGVNEAGKTVTYDLNVLLSDIGSFVSVYLIRDGEVVGRAIKCNCSANTVALPRLRDDECYRFIYRYAPADIGSLMGEGDYNKMTLDVPDNLARILPYAVFGDVYVHYDANIAATLGTQIFESRLAQLPTVYDNSQTELDNISRGYF